MATGSENSAFIWTGALEGLEKLLHGLSGSLGGGAERNGEHKLAVDNEDRGAPPLGAGTDLQVQCRCLQEELERGKEYLKQVQRQLAESRALLEKWNYEHHGGANPILDLIQMIAADECIAVLIFGLLRRQEDRLRELTAGLEVPGATEGAPSKSNIAGETWHRPPEAASADWMWL